MRVHRIPTTRRFPRALTVIALVVVAFLAAWLLSGCGGKSISVPVDSCTRSATGRTQENLQYSCAAYDQKTSACTIQVPIYTTSQEIVYECRFARFE